VKPVTAFFAWAGTFFAGLATTGAPAQPLPLDSLFGIRLGRTFTWRANGIALYFNSGLADNHARIRMVNLAWEAEDAKEQEERRQRLRSRGLI
jgi:hypothetical protein